MAKYSELTKAILATGRSPIEFVPKVLGITYTIFRYRMRTGHFHLEDIHTLTHVLGKTFEELWPNPNVARHQRIPMSPSITNQQPTKKAAAEKPPRTPKKREPVSFIDEPAPQPLPPKEEVRQPKRVFKAIDPFESVGGIPPLAPVVEDQ